MRTSRLSKYSIVKLYQNAAKMRPARRRPEVVRNPSLNWIRDYEYPTSFGADSGGSVAVIRMITGQRASGIRPFSPVSYELSVNGKVVGTFENERKAFGAAEQMLAPQSPESIPDRPVDAALKEASTTMGAALLSGTSELVSKETAISESKWSQYQRDIFAFIRDGVGNAIIEAVAGSGKTTTIMESLKYIPRNKSVLILAFNKSIELELRQRVPEGHNVSVKTLTAFGFTFLRQYWANKYDKHTFKKRDSDVIQDGIGSNFDVLTRTSGGLKVIKSVSDLVALCQSYLAESTDEITAIQNDHLVLVDEADQTAESWSFVADKDKGIKFKHDDVLRWVKASLRNQLKQPDLDKTISFRDMVYVSAMHPEWPSRRLYDFVFVDETQDTDVAQLSLVMRAVRPGGRIICVGDRRQSIYRFRGADDEAMPRMQKRLDAKMLPLSVSYRVTQCSALEARKIVPAFEVPEGTPPGICAEISAGRMIENWQIGDIVIGRINAPILSLALVALSQGKLPLIMGEADQIQKVLNRVIESVARKMSFKDRSVEAMEPLIDKWADEERQRVTNRVVQWKIDKKWTEYMVEDEVTGKTRSNFLNGVEEEPDYVFAGIASEALKDIIQRPDINSIADLKEFIKKIAPDDEDLEGMSKDPDKFKRLRKTRIVFTSAHRIKGGEGRRIFVLEETFGWGRKGKIGTRAQSEKEEIQEQNLWYVAVTRVMHQRADEKKGIPARDGEMYFVTKLDNIVGRLPNQEFKKTTKKYRDADDRDDRSDDKDNRDMGEL
jgi:superfamily I DNA/RNA helicase